MDVFFTIKILEQQLIQCSQNKTAPTTLSMVLMWVSPLHQHYWIWKTMASMTWLWAIVAVRCCSTHAHAVAPTHAAAGVVNAFTQQHPPHACATPTRPAHIAPHALQENWNSFTKVVKVFMVPSHRRASPVQQENGVAR